MNTYANCLPTSLASIHRADRFILPGLYILLLALAACSSGPSAALKELRLGDTTVKYSMQSCKPTARWTGFSLVLEGLNVPKQGDLKFSIGKIDYSERSLQEIKDTVFYYDGLLTATCQTLVRLTGQDAIERYSIHRDTLLQSLADMLTRLERASSETVAKAATAEGRATANSLGSSPKTP